MVLLGIALLLGIVVLLGCGKNGARPETRTPGLVAELSPSVPHTVALAPGEKHRYRLKVSAGEAWRLALEQQEVDAVVTLYDPAGALVLRMDGTLGTAGTERLEWVVGFGGDSIVEVQAPKGPNLAGHYRVEVSRFKAATEIHQRRGEAVALLSRADSLRDEKPNREAVGERERRLDKVMSLYTRSLEMWESLGDGLWRAEALVRMGFLEEDQLSQSESAQNYYAQALMAVGGQGDSVFEAGVLYHLGWIAEDVGDVLASLEFYERALALRRNAGNRPALALTLNDLGYLHAGLGEWHEALNFYDESLALWRDVGDRSMQARTLHNRGRCQAHAGRFTAALEDLSAALAIRETEPSFYNLASTLTSIGFLRLRLGNAEEALATFRRAANLEGSDGDREVSRSKKRTWAVTLTGLGGAMQALGRGTEAVVYFHQALAAFRGLRDRRHEAGVLRRLAGHHLGRGESKEAGQMYREALGLAQEIGDRRQEAAILLELSRIERQRGDLENAQQFLEKGLGLVEDLRVSQGSFALRTDFFASAQVFYDETIDLLMTRHQRNPGGTFAAQAFDVSERSRARSLLDTLDASPGAGRCGGDPGLSDEEQRVVHQIHARELERLRLLVGGDPLRLAVVEGQLKVLLEQYREVGERWRARCGAVSAFNPLRSEEIRQSVLTADSLLLEYKLGEKRSFLWVLSPEEVTSFELPPRVEVESLARRAWMQLRGSRRRQLRGQVNFTLAQLSEMLLGPVAPRLAGQRLLVVAEDALHYIPFAALPLPAEAGVGVSGEPLVSVHKVVQQLSATALASLQERSRRRVPARWTVAVFADPVFEASDARVVGGSRIHDRAPVASTRGGQLQTSRSYRRLPNSALEAAAIEALVPEDERLMALGFRASRDLVLSGRLLDYRILHFATHGRLDTVYPELSGLVLSRIDESGQATNDGHLGVHEIFRLELAADLVALSACETALGREIRGEGLVGLTQGFFHAGASRVLVSLWNIDDQATAQLMASFYSAYLADGLEPAEALQQAQNTVRQQPGWEAPYYWAAFVLLGDW
jgi:CHAT domain-containing protein/tetratricopeptide (TPR) repeat protein